MMKFTIFNEFVRVKNGLYGGVDDVHYFFFSMLSFPSSIFLFINLEDIKFKEEIIIRNK